MALLCTLILILTGVDSVWAGERVYLRRLFATGRRGGAAGGGQGGGAGLGRAFLPGRRHLVQAVLSGRVGLHAAGGRRVLGAKHDGCVYCTGFLSASQSFSPLTNECWNWGAYFFFLNLYYRVGLVPPPPFLLMPAVKTNLNFWAASSAGAASLCFRCLSRLNMRLQLSWLNQTEPGTFHTVYWVNSRENGNAGGLGGCDNNPFLTET